MHNEDSMKRAQIAYIKKELGKVEDLTARQVDMIAVALLSMPRAIIDEIIEQIKVNPSQFMKEIRIPGKRY